MRANIDDRLLKTYSTPKRKHSAAGVSERTKTLREIPVNFLIWVSLVYPINKVISFVGGFLFRINQSYTTNVIKIFKMPVSCLFEIDRD